MHLDIKHNIDKQDIEIVIPAKTGNGTIEMYTKWEIFLSVDN